MSELKGDLAAALGGFEEEDEEEAVTEAADEAEDTQGGVQKKADKKKGAAGPLDALKHKLAQLEQANEDLSGEVSCLTTRGLNQWWIESQLVAE